MHEQDTPSLGRAGRPKGAGGQGEPAAVGAQERALRALAGASHPRDAVEAVEYLRASLWQNMLAALREPSAADVAGLADRVAQLCSTLLSASLAGPAGARADGPESARAGGLELPKPDLELPERDAPATPAREGVVGEPAQAPRAHAATLAPPAPGVIVDERDRGSPAGQAPAPPMPASARAPATHPARHASTAGGGGFAVRDERAGQADAAPWIAAISRRLRVFEQDHRPFAVLLLELRELDRLRAALAPQELDRLSADVARAISELLAGAGEEPIAQGPGRYWLIAPARDAAAARELARRITDPLPGRVEAAASVLVGVAVCPGNARSAAGLAAHADVDLYAARRPLAARA
jgi:GGDEF domain-containing protein